MSIDLIHKITDNYMHSLLCVLLAHCGEERW